NGLLHDTHETAVVALALVDERIGLDQLAVVLEEIRGLIRHVFREADRRADLRRPELRELGLPRTQQLRDFQQLRAALGRRHARPAAAVERFARGRNGAIDVGRRRLRERHDDLLRDRRDDAQATVRRGLLPFTVDEKAVRRFDRGFRLGLDLRAHRESPCFIRAIGPFHRRRLTVRRAGTSIRWLTEVLSRPQYSVAKPEEARAQLCSISMPRYLRESSSR